MVHNEFPFSLLYHLFINDQREPDPDCLLQSLPEKEATLSSDAGTLYAIVSTDRDGNPRIRAGIRYLKKSDAARL